MENSWEEKSVGLQLLRNGFHLLVHECESLDSIFFFFLDLYYIFPLFILGKFGWGQYA